MNIKESIEKINEAMKDIWDVCNDSWNLDSRFIICLNPSDDKVPPFISFTIGDYDFTLNAEGLRVNYISRGNNYDNFIFDINTSQIVSYTMPPKNKEQP